MTIDSKIFIQYSDVDVNSLFNLIRENKIGFKVESIFIDKGYSYLEGLELLNENILPYLKKHQITFKSSDENNLVTIIIRGDGVKHIELLCRFDSLTQYDITESCLVGRIFNGPNFLAAYINESNFSTSEDVGDIDTYALLFDELPKYRIKTDADGFEYLDTSLSYGRTWVLNGIPFKVSWRSFWGPLFYNSGGVKKMLDSYESAFENKYIDGDVKLLQLTQKPITTFNSEGYQMIRQFYNHVSKLKTP